MLKSTFTFDYENKLEVQKAANVSLIKGNI